MNQRSHSLFREEALQHHLQAEEGSGLARVSPPWTWTLLWLLVAALSAALLAAFFGYVEVTARGRGITREYDRPSAGTAIGKPVAQRLQVISFLAEKDCAFAKPGDEVHLELDQIPYAEYGTLRARVTAIDRELAQTLQVREVLGEDRGPPGPVHRVELEIVDARAAESAQVELRAGMLMDVRFTLRRQRLIALLIDPMRRWFR